MGTKFPFSIALRLFALQKLSPRTCKFRSEKTLFRLTRLKSYKVPSDFQHPELNRIFVNGFRHGVAASSWKRYLLSTIITASLLSSPVSHSFRDTARAVIRELLSGMLHVLVVRRKLLSLSLSLSLHGCN